MSATTVTKEGCCSRVGFLLKLYHSKRIDISDDHSEISVTVVPEAFRIWYYILFSITIFLGIFVTLTWSNIDLNNNPVINTFGANNLCIFFDDPPFSYFGASLFVIVTLFILIYLFLDNIRVFCNYRDGKYGITKGWYIIYTIFTIWHFIAFIWFIQIFATGPTENLPIHYFGYMVLQYAFWTLSVIHLAYFVKIGCIKPYTLYYILGIIYLIMMIIIIIIKTIINVPNVFGAKLFIQYPITMTISDIETPIFTFLVIICPFIIYLIFIDDLDHIHLSFIIKSGYKYNLTYDVENNENEKIINVVDNDDNKECDDESDNDDNNDKKGILHRFDSSIHVENVSDIFTNQSARDDFWPKLRASVFIIIGFPFCLYFLDKYLEVTGFHIIGMMLVASHIYFFLFCYITWFRCKGLYRLQAQYRVPTNWASVPIPYRVVEVRDQAIKSISEFSAIRGTSPHLSLFGIGLLTFGVYLTIFLAISSEWRITSDFHDKWASIFCMGGPAGMTWLGVWELNPNDKCHKFMHYLGVLMGICSNIGLGFALRFNYISAIVVAPGIVGLILWQYFDITAKMPSNDPNYVTQTSLKCLIFESLVILSSTTAFDVYILYGMHL